LHHKVQKFLFWHQLTWVVMEKSFIKQLWWWWSFTGSLLFLLQYQWSQLSGGNLNNSTTITAVFQMIVLPGSLLVLFLYVFQNRTSRDKWCRFLMRQMAFLILSPNRVKALKETVQKSKQDICSTEYY